MKKICILFYTHSEYNDLWQMGMDRILKYGPKYEIYVTVDKNGENIKKLYDFKNIFYYNNADSYATRIINVLDNIEEDYVYIIHDNNVMVGESYSCVPKIEKFIYENDVDQFRLSNSGLTEPFKNTDVIDEHIYKFKTSDHYQYSVFPAIWKKTSWKKLLSNFLSTPYRLIEERNVQDETRKLNNYFIYNKNYDFFGCHIPHYAKFIRIICNGKWFYNGKCSPHTTEINKLINEYNIDLNSRGIFKVWECGRNN
jgi:hypothetical protein